MAESMKLPRGTHGALVASVDDGTPAADAGLQAGDVITAVNDQPVKNEVEVTNTIGLMRPGSEVKLRVTRESQTKELRIKLAAFSGSDEGDRGRANETSTIERAHGRQERYPLRGSGAP